jgi:phytoene desaturase
MYRAQMRRFIDTNIDSPFGLVTPALARLVAMGGLRRLAPTVDRYLRDPRTRRVFSFQSMYAGLSPYEALAVYAVIAYMDCVAGVYFPRGGMHALPTALAGAAAKHGVQFRYGCDVQRVELAGDRATAVITGDGERVPCDAVVLNADLPVACRDLLGRPMGARRRPRYSPSCFLLLAGSSARYAQTAHHNIHFGAAWRTVFDEVVTGGRLMSDPSLLVTSPTVGDPELAPAGRHIYSVLLPTPNTDSGIDWAAVGPRYRAEVLSTLEARGYRGFGEAIDVEATTTPWDWRASGLERGTPFSLAHTPAQTGPFRPSNLWGANVVFAGSGTTPGVGIPMVLISGRLAAERVTGPDRSYVSRAWA